VHTSWRAGGWQMISASPHKGLSFGISVRSRSISAIETLEIIPSSPAILKSPTHLALYRLNTHAKRAARQVWMGLDTRRR